MSYRNLGRRVYDTLSELEYTNYGSSNLHHIGQAYDIGHNLYTQYYDLAKDDSNISTDVEDNNMSDLPTEADNNPRKRLRGSGEGTSEATPDAAPGNMSSSALATHPRGEVGDMMYKTPHTCRMGKPYIVRNTTTVNRKFKIISATETPALTNEGTAPNEFTVVEYPSWHMLPVNNFKNYVMEQDVLRLCPRNAYAIRPTHIKVCIHTCRILTEQPLSSTSVTSVDEPYFQTFIDHNKVLQPEVADVANNSLKSVNSMGTGNPNPSVSAQLNTYKHNMFRTGFWRPDATTITPYNTGNLHRFYTIPFESMGGHEFHNRSDKVILEHSLQYPFKSGIIGEFEAKFMKAEEGDDYQTFDVNGLTVRFNNVDYSGDSIPVMMIKIPLTTTSDDQFIIKSRLDFWVEFTCHWETLCCDSIFMQRSVQTLGNLNVFGNRDMLLHKMDSTNSAKGSGTLDSAYAGLPKIDYVKRIENDNTIMYT